MFFSIRKRSLWKGLRCKWKKNCQPGQLFYKYRPLYVKIIYVDIKIKGYGMSAIENDKGYSKELKTVSQCWTSKNTKKASISMLLNS